MIAKLIDFILHIDVYISLLIQQFGALTYVIMFVIILCETGLVVTPFLPGDSLLFAAGTFAAQGMLNIVLLFFMFLVAAILGDSLNYWIGDVFGEKVLIKKKLLKMEHLEQTKEFYRKYGGKAIIYSRFVPIVRTIAPFVAGVGKMKYSRFLGFNIIGAILWVSLFTFSGYLFGELTFVKENLSLIIAGIIVVSLIPGIIEVYKGHRHKKYHETVARRIPSK